MMNRHLANIKRIEEAILARRAAARGLTTDALVNWLLDNWSDDELRALQRVLADVLRNAAPRDLATVGFTPAHIGELIAPVNTVTDKPESIPAPSHVDREIVDAAWERTPDELMRQFEKGLTI